MRATATKTTLTDLLEPYRGRRGALRKEHGHEGLRMLHAHPEVNGSPRAATEFLGFATNYESTISKDWAILGMPANRREPGSAVVGSEYLQEIEGSEAMTGVELIRARYAAETSEPQLARVVDWSIPRDLPYGHLICISDLHYGPKNMAYTKWLRLRDWIAENRHVRWIGLGDFLDTAVSDSPGMGGEGQVLKFDQAMELLVDDLKPIAKQCLQLCSGNHEARIARTCKINFSPLKVVAQQLGIYYRTVSASRYLLIRLKQGKHVQQYSGFFHHGFGSGRTVGGKLSPLLQTIAWNEVDMVAFGHTHLLQVIEQVRKYLGAEVIEKDGQQWVQVKSRRIPLASCGSFLDHEDDTYAQDMGLAPGNIGSAAFHLFGDHHDIHGRV